MDKKLHFPFSNESDLKHTLTSIAAKVKNALLLNCIKPEYEKILKKKQNGFRRNRSTASQILTIHRIIEGVQEKSLVNTIDDRFLQDIWSST